jgi:hypothetical protein
MSTSSDENFSPSCMFSTIPYLMDMSIVIVEEMFMKFPLEMVS